MCLSAWSFINWLAMWRCNFIFAFSTKCFYTHYCTSMIGSMTIASITHKRGRIAVKDTKWQMPQGRMVRSGVPMLSQR
jgi:hypothetical protein